MMRAARRTSAVAVGGSLAALTVLAGQARYTVRRDLPSMVGSDASGVEVGGAGATKTVRLGAVGDSTLTGPGLDDSAAIWVRRVARSVADLEQVDVEVVSFAVGGSRVRDVLESQLDAVIASAPHVVLVAVGTNDAIHCTPLGRFERDFGLLICRLVDRVPAVVIGGLGDLAGIARVPFPLGAALAARGRRVNSVIRSIAAQHSLHYVDISSVDRAFRVGGAGVFSLDLFHPDEHGHALWANAAAPVVAHAIRGLDC